MNTLSATEKMTEISKIYEVEFASVSEKYNSMSLMDVTVAVREYKKQHDIDYAYYTTRDMVSAIAKKQAHKKFSEKFGKF